MKTEFVFILKFSTIPKSLKFNVQGILNKRILISPLFHSYIFYKVLTIHYNFNNRSCGIVYVERIHIIFLLSFITEQD